MKDQHTAETSALAPSAATAQVCVCVCVYCVCVCVCLCLCLSVRVTVSACATAQAAAMAARSERCYLQVGPPFRTFEPDPPLSVVSIGWLVIERSV